MLATILSLMMAATYSPSILTIPIAHAEEKLWTQEMVKELARDTANEYKLNTQKFLHTLNCENLFRAKGQSERRNKKGEREMSFGAAQIHIPSHPTITREQAESPEFAVKWMAEKWSEGNAYLWSCWLQYTAEGWPEERL
mgnify:CR=1 FL=1